MTACFYIKQRQGEAHPHEVVKELKQKRFVVSSAVARYEVVEEYHKHVLQGADGHGGSSSSSSSTTSKRGSKGKTKKAKAT